MGEETAFSPEHDAQYHYSHSPKLSPVLYIQALSPSLTRHMYAPFVAVMYEMLQCTEGGWSLSGESRSLDKTRRLTT